MTPNEKSIFHFVAVAVTAALLSMPSALATPSLGLGLVLLPFGSVFLIHRLERESKCRFSNSKTCLLTLVVAAVFAAAFHAGHGFGDLEGVFVGLLLCPLMFSGIRLLGRASSVMDACERDRAGKPEVADDSPGSPPGADGSG